MVLVLVDEITPRLSYVFDFIFKERAIDYQLTTSAQFFSDASFKKLNYSQQSFHTPSIFPSVVLFDKSIKIYNVAKAEYDGIDCLTFDGDTDIVASIFYVLTRYEEYICTTKDNHGRFPFSESCLKKFNWIEKVVCDRWANFIVKFVDEKIQHSDVKIVPTFDIDNTYAYQLKRGKQKYLSVIKDIICLNINRLKERLNVAKGQVDPYDTFESIKNIANKFPETKMFWLVGEHAEKDRNIPLSNAQHQNLIKEMDLVSEVNLHPSYASNGSLKIIQKEKSSLEAVLSRKLVNSRQHFLRFQLPDTFQTLIEGGFTNEYSMGFAEAVGFRCGTARSHFWFDLSKNSVSSLLIHPFSYMDGSLNEYMLLSIDESKEKIQQLFEEVCQYGGNFIFLWHNETIGNYGKWKGWSRVLDFTLNLKNE